MKKHTLLIMGMLKELREENNIALIESTVYDFLAMLDCGLINESEYELVAGELEKIKMEKQGVNGKEFGLGVAI